jgi:hypothetical protein
VEVGTSKPWGGGGAGGGAGGGRAGGGGGGGGLQGHTTSLIGCGASEVYAPGPDEEEPLSC